MNAFFRSPKLALRQGLPSEDLLAALVTLLKIYFAPMMAMSLMAFSLSAIENGSQAFRGDALAGGFKPLFDLHGFWFVMQSILLIDTLMFTVGYLVELPQLGNSIRSVDRTCLGWTAALLCYPPFNGLTGAILGSQRSDFPQFEDATAHLVLNCLLLTLMAVYASASVALGFKASNLTHRGIVARDPYALIRHPAYTCKNLAWWMGGLYAVSCGTQQSHFPGRERSDAPTGCLSLNVRTRAMAMEVDARERSIRGFSWRGKECIAWTTALWTCGQAQMQSAHMPTGLNYDQRL